MTIMELGAIGEFVGAIAVVVTLIYLAVQLRQNSKMVQMSMIQAAERGISDVVGEWSRDAETASLINRGRGSLEELSDDERARLRLLIRRMFLHMDSMHYAFKQGALPNEIWDRESVVMRAWINTDAGKAAWKQGGFTESFQQYVDANLLR